MVYLLVGGLAAYGLVGAALSPATSDPRNKADVAKRRPASPFQEVGGCLCVWLARCGNRWMWALGLPATQGMGPGGGPRAGGR